VAFRAGRVVLERPRFRKTFEPQKYKMQHKLASGRGTSMARLPAVEREGWILVLRANDQDRAIDPSGWERKRGGKHREIE
jgi:hypothetical protein